MLSLVLPTFNESENLPVLLPKIAEALEGIPHEVIVVDDDSPDGTWRVAREAAERDSSLRVIRRVGRRGLSSAVIEGFLAATGDVLAVMDADGQHDLAVLPRLYASVRGGGNVAIGSRYAEGGSVGQWDERRHALSRMATRLAIRLCKVRVHDPMSGFFAIDRRTFEAALPRLNPKGFKILLDLLVHAPHGTTAVELPFTFGARLHGESKLSRRVQIEFLEYLYDVTLGSYVPLMFLKYCLVGIAGVAVNVVAYLFISRVLAEEWHAFLGFSTALLGGIETAIVFNFLLNNAWTFSHARLRGARAASGFLTYNAACLFGALASYSVSSSLFERGVHEMLSVMLGALVGVIWNYTMSRLFTWRV